MRRTKEFLREGHLPTLIGAFLCFCVCSMCWLLLGGLGSHIAAELKLTSVQKGFLTAVPLLGGGLLRLPFGWLADTSGAKTPGLLGLGFTALPGALGWLWGYSSPSFLFVG